MDRERDIGARPQSWRDRGRSEAGQPERPEQPERPVSEPDPPATTDGATAHEVERRTVGDRRVADEPVLEERRVEARRQRDREAKERRAYVVQRVTLGVDYLFYLLYGLLTVRFVLSLLGAAETAGFVQLIQGMTDPFYAPFSGIVGSPSLNGGVLDFPVVIALLAYVLLHIAVRGLLRLIAGDRAVP
jgi:YggT family protein